MKDGGVAMVMRVEHAGSGRVPLEARREGGGDEEGRAVLPVAVGHGVLNLLLLEELCDGQ